MEENFCNFLSSRGILKSCDIFSFRPVSDTSILHDYNLYNLVDNSILYIPTSAIPFFLKNIFDKLENKIILVTGDSDNTSPTDIFVSNDDLNKFIETEKIIHWFSQNCILSAHPKITQLPIGLDYHTMSIQNHSWGNKTSPIEQEKILENIISTSKPFYERIINAYSNFHFFTTTKFGYDRIEAQEKIPKELVYYEPNKIERIKTWENQSKYAFVISPHGNGLDCHRTWEALCLGCIPIVKSSPLDALYTDLPVLILKDWNLLTQELMVNTINDFKNKNFNYDKLKLKYWIDKIKSYKNVPNLKNNLINTFSVVIAGCCINVERFIKRNLFIMNEIGKRFKDYKIIIYENDSKDNTREILINNKKDNCDYIFENNVNITNRTERIAHCRNKILQHINNNYNNYDYMLMLDLDDVLISGKLINTIHTCFLYNHNQWDAMFANCLDKYYDIYALRKKNYLTSCCWNNVNLLKLTGVPHSIAYKECIDKFIINYPIDKGLISVISAFGGAGLYKIKSIGNAEYNGYDTNHIDKQVCEHVSFNTNLINKGCKLYINPKMIIY